MDCSSLIVNIVGYTLVDGLVSIFDLFVRLTVF